MLSVFILLYLKRNERNKKHGQKKGEKLFMHTQWLSFGVARKNNVLSYLYFHSLKGKYVGTTISNQ